jgi:3-phenylpropionate/trans-cinnamate dioxygenase ferredoxin subunit
MNWTPVDQLTIDAIPEGKPIQVRVGERAICVLRKSEVVFAFAATCPHSGGRFCEGWLDPLGRVVCPLHKYRFDPVNGRNTSGEGYKLRTYPVEVREGAIFVSLPE